jgi:hypothetical protein
MAAQPEVVAPRERDQIAAFEADARGGLKFDWEATHAKASIGD